MFTLQDGAMPTPQQPEAASIQLNRREQREQRGTDKVESGFGARDSPYQMVMREAAWHEAKNPTSASVSVPPVPHRMVTAEVCVPVLVSESCAPRRRAGAGFVAQI